MTKGLPEYLWLAARGHLRSCFVLHMNGSGMRTGGSFGCAPGGDAGGSEFETLTGPTLRVLK